MKRIHILYILICIMMLPVINAEFRVDQVKAYVNNDRVSGFDEDGGDVD